jgi:6-pyruvoyltetrahydropterin/6-carboxytetrahydropterin synthase
MHWKISKEFDFCYGHRVWSQTLNSEFSIDSCLKCRHLHGHQGKVIVYLQAEELKDGMVTDFKHLNWFKLFLDDVLDHKFILDINDPLFSKLLPDIKKDELVKFDEGYVIVDFVPTSENISAWLLKIVAKKMAKLNVEVSHIEFLETPKSKSTFYA